MKHPSEQSVDEWLSDYDGTPKKDKPVPLQVVNLRPQIEDNKLRQRVKNAGFELRKIKGGLLVKKDSYVTDIDKSRIVIKLNELADIAEPDTGESLYIYSGYRTFFARKKECLAIEFTEIHTGAIAVRYFNTNLRDTRGNSYKTGANCKFRITGNPKQPKERTFIKLWMDAIKQIPDNRPSHIYRYMNAKLSGMVVSCAEPKPHHDITKLTKVKYEGHLYIFS